MKVTFNDKSYEVHSYGTLVKVKHKILDQLNGVTLVKMNEFPRYLELTYGMDLETYYNLITRGVPNPPLCKCGNPLPFRGLYRLYPKVCSNECSYKHSFTVVSGHPDKFIHTEGMIKFHGEDHIIYNPGELTRTSRVTILDQLSGDSIVKGCNRLLDPYLKERYGITVKEYYNLCVYGDSNYVHMCSHCKLVPTEFRSVVVGYNKYCCTECQSLGFYENKSYKGIGSSINSTLLAAKNSFITKHKGENGYLYLATLVDYDLVKVGVTTNLVRRSKYSLNSYGEYKSIKPIIYGPVEYISDLEYRIKLEFHERSKLGSECFDWSCLHDLIEFIESIR